MISTFDPSLRDVDPGVKRKPKIFCHVLIQQSQGTIQASMMSCGLTHFSSGRFFRGIGVHAPPLLLLVRESDVSSTSTQRLDFECGAH